MAGENPLVGRVERWVSVGTTVLAPATGLGALLFYFGYVSSRTQYAYFGMDVDTIGLSTRDYIMRSPQPLLVPLLVLSLAAAGWFVADGAVRRHIDSTAVRAAAEASNAAPDPAPGDRLEAIRRLALLSARLAAGVLAGGVVLLFAYAALRDWPLYGLITPLLFACGCGGAAYARRVLGLLHASRGQPAAAAAHPDRQLPARQATTALIFIVLAASVFWATATVAQWSGRGLARDQARNLGTLPSVILDTKEQLFLHDPGVQESVLPAGPGQTFHYRYRHLRLLIEGNGRMFLVPEAWSPSDTTLVVELDDQVRIQFQFENQAP